MEYKFRMPIGDWSGDGHGKCDYYLIKSNKSVEDVREAHFLIKEKTRVDIDQVCSNYEENTLSGAVAYTLEKLGFFESLSDVDADDSYSYYNEEYTMHSYGLARLWMFLLQKADESLRLEIINDNVENLPFYGFDKQGRHIGFNGYGVHY